MSTESSTPSEGEETRASVAMRIEPRQKDLGEFTVRRVLPAGRRKMVGPFIFFDHMGPAEFLPGQGINVRPHPHIGIATITYLFEGEIIHRDSLGFTQPIRAGAVNLMLAGRGIVHSERAGDDLASHSRLHGIQSWIALPDEHAETAPDFRHYPAQDLPSLEIDDVRVRVILGSLAGHRSPVQTFSPTLYLECRMPAGSRLTLPASELEQAAYVVSGEVEIDRQSFGAGVMAVANDGVSMTLAARTESLVMVIGGAPVGERHIWWNFVSASPDRIERAKQDWRNQRMGRIAGDDEFIPLPD